ncbi:MAG: hypothetical protein M5R40_14305 [Anaerolineae bacterium]|nr:hypothetical protein [Anaerolineae bacterium]
MGASCWRAWPAWPPPALPGPALAAYVGIGGVIAAMGWIDDTRALPVRPRLAVQLCLGLVMAAAAGVFAQADLPPLGVLEFGAILGVALTVLWLVGMVNVFNFMDGIDGIAGVQAAIAGGGGASCCWSMGRASLRCWPGWSSPRAWGSCSGMRRPRGSSWATWGAPSWASRWPRCPSLRTSRRRTPGCRARGRSSSRRSCLTAA